MPESFRAGRDFIYRQGRVLERRLFAARYQGAPAPGVFDALRAYRNPDGGFGHGLEPDKRCPASLPIDVEMALSAMAMVGGGDPELLQGACDFLSATAAAAAGGAVAPATPAIEEYPRAVHWSEWTYQPGLNPTAGLVGLLRQLGVEHQWVTDGSQFCWGQLESADLSTEAHTLSEVLIFLDHNPERERADRIAQAVIASLPTAQPFRWDLLESGYGLTPLHLAPTPSSRWRPLFSDSQISSHLNRLQSDQEEDGGWPLTWEPPSEASTLEWRGIETLRALNTLVAYGRVAAELGAAPAQRPPAD
ncbi:MAG: hypothetical protein ACRENX_10775 [Candidatus Dormibacteria bacterium]